MQTDKSRHLRLVADPSPDQVDDDRRSRRSVGQFEFRRPELAPVLSQAMSAVIQALDLGEQAPQELIYELERIAATAMTEAYEPFADAASRLAESTETTRKTEAASVQRRAEKTANLVAQTTIALRQRHDRLAGRVAEEARSAAHTAAASAVPGFKIDARRRAHREAVAVSSAAAARAQQRADVAGLTAEAAGRAETRLAIDAEHAAVIVQRDALQAAAAIRVMALSTMYEIAIDAACRHFVDASMSKPSCDRP